MSEIKDTELYAKLSAPFDYTFYKPAKGGDLKKDGKTFKMFEPYIEVNQARRRLDDVFGVMNWDSTIEEMASSSKSMICSIIVNYKICI